ncbi:OmpP1/FadL family transporter [Celeribacter persicus]|jgi:Long-chain fatty acid transport protein|uniref:Long-subunit fatty acid transport protein n=1 Tax=Celeribacter persicus TaxID=1651082 RepID=A0A2T5HK65_9RHOB|nr:outer membrane protein transport protein [Celeribacter persicus]PTQ71936.1 long-subunit fatty acid transport protein [Celeribacter persicus]
MKNTTLLAASLAVGATGAYAGGMDRSGMSIAPLFETGTYVELSFGSVNPDVSGSFAASVPLIGGISSGDLTPSYTQLSAAYKRDLSENLSMAIILDQPFGADVDYPDGTGYVYQGSNASVETTGVTAVLRYKFNDRFSVHGGVRNLTSKGTVEIPIVGPRGYTMETSTENDWGYLIGAAYEIPDIALRASLTYNSAIDIDFTASEDFSGGTAAANKSPLSVTMPQSVNFDFQTGIAADTLLMFSARWAEWTETVIAPQLYSSPSFVNDNLVDHNDDTISYSLGVGRRFNDKLSGSLSVGYEKSYGGLQGNLSPRDGYKSITAGLKYQITEQTAISGGVSYVWVGDAKTTYAPSINPSFEDNTAIGVGLKLSHHF